MSLTSVAAATQILANAMKALDSLREQAKGSTDVALKEKISGLYDTLLDLKAAVLRAAEENAELKRANSELLDRPNPEIRQFGLANYYFVGDKGPFCQPCYDRLEKLVPLAPQDMYAGGLGRKCEVCNKVFFENHGDQQQSIRPFGGGAWG
jgi:hypothetical protein